MKWNPLKPAHRLFALVTIPLMILVMALVPILIVNVIQSVSGVPLSVESFGIPAALGGILGFIVSCARVMTTE